MEVIDGEFEIKMRGIRASELKKVLEAGDTRQDGFNVCSVNIHKSYLEKFVSEEVLFDGTFTIRIAGFGSREQTAAVLRVMDIIK